MAQFSLREEKYHIYSRSRWRPPALDADDACTGGTADAVGLSHGLLEGRQHAMCVNQEPSGQATRLIATGIDSGSKTGALIVKSSAHTYLNIQAVVVAWVNKWCNALATCQACRFCNTPQCPPGHISADTASSGNVELVPCPLTLAVSGQGHVAINMPWALAGFRPTAQAESLFSSALW